MSPDQLFNSSSTSFPPVLAQVPSLVEESAQPEVTADESSTAIPPAPDGKSEPHRQDGAPGDDQKQLGDRGICQPALRLEIPAPASPSTESTDGYLRLRPWQERCLNTLIDSHNWIINAPMAAGKTFEIAAIAGERLRRNSDLRIIISVPQTPIAAGFRRYSIELPDGNRLDWEIQPELDLCSENAANTTSRLLDFLCAPIATDLMGRVVLCTHSTLVRAFGRSAAAFQNVLIVVDEAHHVRHPGVEDAESKLTNQLGALVRYGLGHPNIIQLGFTTATFFRCQRRNKTAAFSPVL